MAGGNYDSYALARHFEQISERFARIETQLALLSEKLGVPYDPPSAGVPTEVVQLARAGKELEAIKLYRAMTNASLVEAREVVLGL
ncbi:hypothetical protein [Sphaerisporangium perillae]|uniref:hypothetical protein n=1 Tax=Sphaerisporangium perillae TaxID=2935860 RepID=UPI00200E7CB6|nr:hypothetical protein [Sphaerisporangium perillae]